MKLRYTIRAAAELDEILTSIDEQSPQGARHRGTNICAHGMVTVFALGRLKIDQEKHRIRGSF